MLTRQTKEILRLRPMGHNDSINIRIEKRL